MKHQLQTIREFIESAHEGEWASYVDRDAAITALSEIEAMVWEKEQSLAFYKRRCDALQQWQNKMRDPERTIVCDILANGHTLEPAGNRYATPPAQPQYEAGDMASAHNDGFRAGVASVAQQPQAEAVRWCPDVCPITGKPFFMWIGHPKHGEVPTYGGPYDSYTIPVRHEDGSFCCERYDHDNGWWVADEVHDVGVQIVSDQAYVSDEAPQQAEAVPKDHPLYVFATEVIHGAYRYTELPAKARAAIDAAMAQGEKP